MTPYDKTASSLIVFEYLSSNYVDVLSSSNSSSCEVSKDRSPKIVSNKAIDVEIEGKELDSL